MTDNLLLQQNFESVSGSMIILSPISIFHEIRLFFSNYIYLWVDLEWNLYFLLRFSKKLIIQIKKQIEKKIFRYTEFARWISQYINEDVNIWNDDPKASVGDVFRYACHVCQVRRPEINGILENLAILNRSFFTIFVMENKHGNSQVNMIRLWTN